MICIPQVMAIVLLFLIQLYCGQILKFETNLLFTGCFKVRALWSAIDDMLATTKEEQHAMASVLKGDVDQYVLDGTNRTLKIPRCLLERVEQLPHQVRVKMSQIILLAEARWFLLYSVGDLA